MIPLPQPTWTWLDACLLLGSLAIAAYMGRYLYWIVGEVAKRTRLQTIKDVEEWSRYD